MAAINTFFSSITFIALLCFAANAQLPNSQLYSFKLSKLDTLYTLSQPKYLSFFNPQGYNNQPSFKDNFEMYFVSNVYNENSTDLFYFDFQHEFLVQITATEASEYSPEYNTYKQVLNCIRVNEKGDQTMWEYPLDNSHWGKPVLPTVDNAGYYFIYNKDTIVVFQVGDPHELRLFTTDGKISRGLSQNIGRCFDQLSDGKMTYVHKISPDKWMLRSMDLTTAKSEFIIEMPLGVEDYVVLQDNTVICGSESILYYYQVDQPERKWEVLDDMSFYRISNLTRIAVNKSEDILVLVGTPIKEE